MYLSRDLADNRGNVFERIPIIFSRMYRRWKLIIKEIFLLWNSLYPSLPTGQPPILVNQGLYEMPQDLNPWKKNWVYFPGVLNRGFFPGVYIQGFTGFSITYKANQRAKLKTPGKHTWKPLVFSRGLSRFLNPWKKTGFFQGFRGKPSFPQNPVFISYSPW